MQISACWHHVKVKSVSPALSPSCYPPNSQACISTTHVLLLHKTLTRGPRLVYNAANNQKSAPVCLFGGKGKPEDKNEVTFFVRYLGRWSFLQVFLVLEKQSRKEFKLEVFYKHACSYRKCYSFFLT